MQPEMIHEIIRGKYEKLLWTIARKISGDNVATSSLEDNFQDLWLAAFEAVEGFIRQNDYSNGPVEDWIETKAFDKYLKTCLWNRKNHRGKQIANKYEIHRDTVPTDLEQVLNVSAPDSLSCPDLFADLRLLLSQDEKVVLASLLVDPGRYLTEGGKVKIRPLHQKLGWPRKRALVCVTNINKKMNGGLI
jgi:hypothetical protein